jgi:hypothetical protein
MERLRRCTTSARPAFRPVVQARQEVVHSKVGVAGEYWRAPLAARDARDGNSRLPAPVARAVKRQISTRHRISIRTLREL